MLVETIDAAAVTDRWLGSLDTALRGGDRMTLSSLWHDDCHWRDVLALTWDIQTFSGAATVVRELIAHAAKVTPSNFVCEAGRVAPRLVMRAGQKAVEAIVAFETASGRCKAVLRLTPDSTSAGTFKAWTLVTVLDEIKGHEESVGERRPTGAAYSKDFSGPNWLDRRHAAVAFEDREPAVVVVGAGQAGLSIAARLKLLGVDTLLVERLPRVGDNWRKRYHALSLHNQVHVNHLPYMPYPPGWPTYIPKDKLAGWFEAYAESMELNVWNGTEMTGASYDAVRQRWLVSLKRADGTIREMRPRHLVMATGASDTPVVPKIETLEHFKGPVLHSSQFKESESWRGKRALVIGTGTSGHDIAQDLHSHGVRVAMVQRATTMVVNIEPSAQLPYRLYEEGLSLEDGDLITVGTPFVLLKRSYQLLTEEGRQIDKPLLDRLEDRGFKLDFGEEGTGWQMKYLTRGGGYYFNVGCSDLIADGKIELLQMADIATFEANGVRLNGGRVIEADLVVLATGYRGQEHLLRRLLGDEIAEKIGPIWGFGEGQELRNMFKRTAQPGLWFMAGSFAQCRIYSKFLALQIKAVETGLMQGGS